MPLLKLNRKYKAFPFILPKGSQFWNSFFLLPVVEQNGRFRNSSKFDFLEECIIFGFHLRGEIFEVLNICILNTKYYIHNKRLLDDNNIEFLHFLYVLKFILDIEHKICKTTITHTHI